MAAEPDGCVVSRIYAEPGASILDRTVGLPFKAALFEFYVFGSDCKGK